MRSWAALGVLSFLLLTTVASAQIVPSGNVYLGYSYVRADLSTTRPLASSFSNSNLNGWNGSLEFKFIPWIGGVADFGGTYGTSRVTPPCEAIPSPPCGPFDVHAHVYTFLFGPRVSVSLSRFTPFAHVLLGAGHISADGSIPGDGNLSTSETSFTTAVGGGLDYKLIKGVAWRFQGDDLHTRFFNSSQNNLRLATGIVFRF
ncbi:MAG TPA: outer membrane beta-barrel protein [Terriglobales bacterium]|nr:outer membrane beta-barrel protein [Terriglobales bacterium]